MRFSGRRKEKLDRTETENRHVWLFLLEICLSIVIFVIASVVILTVFVAGHQKNIHAEELHIVNTDLENVEELIRSTDRVEDLEKNIASAYDISDKDKSGWTISLNEQYDLIVTEKEEKDDLYTFQLTLKKDGRKEAESLTVRHVMQKE